MIVFSGCVYLPNLFLVEKMVASAKWLLLFCVTALDITGKWCKVLKLLCRFKVGISYHHDCLCFSKPTVNFL